MSEKRYIVRVTYEPAPRSFTRDRDASASSPEDAREQVRRAFLEDNPGVTITQLTVTNCVE